MPRKTHNPDVLSCLANLSSDEVFTPPRIANDVLDMLPADLWQNPNATFLDPVSKSGVFLREIARRLNEGLKEHIPDQQERINHILTKQVFGIAITDLTALISRRSVYCSKTANGKYSICTAFNDADGNVRYRRVEHKWEKGRCIFCGAAQAQYDREEALETHAYEFIHTEKPEEIFGMRFDVIVGNPPYQLSDGGHGRSATPIYQHFVRQAKRLNPRYLTMIIPARWYGGGKGLGDFRQEMLNDERIRKLVDYEDSRECFPGVDVAGGICYFLWDRDYRGLCEVVNVRGKEKTVSCRQLNEFDVFIREKMAVEIIKKIIQKTDEFLSSQVYRYKPFGLRTYVKPTEEGDINLRWKGGIGKFYRDKVTAGHHMIDRWKVICSRSGHEHGGGLGVDGARRVLSVIDILPPGTVCTETYLVVGDFDSEEEAKNMVFYMKTRFFRFLLSQLMFSHSITKDTFEFIPKLSVDIRWTDDMLYKRYNLNDDEIRFIESKIREMS